MGLLTCFKPTQQNNIKYKNNTLQTVREKLEHIIITNTTIVNSDDDSSYLYVILPYFNYCGSKSRKKLFMDFINKYSKTTGIRICIGEAKINGGSYELPQSMSNIYSHIGITTNDCIWIKETLINIVISKLPSNWKYVAWIDADISFLNTNWVNETIIKLQSNDVLHYFKLA